MATIDSVSRGWLLKVETLKKLLVVVLKIALSVAILAWLIRDAIQGSGNGNVFENLARQPKHWGLLAGAGLFSFAAVALTLIRWCYLVRALDIPFSMKDALRIGFLGYLFNFFPLGIVAGDLVKVLMLGREHPRHRAKALASVVIDRLIGLYMLFVVATVAILVTRLWRCPEAEIRLVCQATFLVTGAGAAGILVLLLPGVAEGTWTQRLAGLHGGGHALASVIEAGRVYRQRLSVVAISAVLSIGVHVLFSIGVYFVARGLPGQVLSFGTFFVIMPLSAAAGVLPLPLGPFEAVLEFLYTHVPAGVIVPKGQGLVIALAYRLITVLIAAVGFGYYLASRRELAEVIQAAEQD